jgi:RNA polymerase sigma-70 factor (ECF subfamily)
MARAVIVNAMAEDAELLVAWRGGDAAAGEVLVDRHFAIVTRFFRNKVDDGLEDLVQKTFVALLEAGQAFRGESSFRGYLLGVAHNLLRRHYRERKRDERIDFGTASVADVGVRPSELLAVRREQRRLLEALRRIPIEHQILLELFYWESMSASEIGEVLQAPEGTIRTRLRRARQLLERRLAELVGGGEPLVSTLAQLDDWARVIREQLAR